MPRSTRTPQAHRTKEEAGVDVRAAFSTHPDILRAIRTNRAWTRQPQRNS